MGQYMPLIIAILIIAAIVFVIERRRAGKKAAAAAEAVEESPEAQAGYAGKVTGGIKNLRNRVMPGKSPELGRQFQSWAADGLSKHKTLQKWLTSMTDEEAASFAAQLDDFCNDVNLDLGWLLQKEMSKDPAIEEAATTVVLEYCQACYKAAQAQADFQTFATAEALIKSPKEHRELSQALFTELVKQKLADPVSPDLFLASEEERQAHMTAAIKQAAEKERQKFVTVLKSVMAAQEEAAAADSGKTQSWTSKITKPFKKSEQPVPTATPSPSADDAKPA